MAKKVSGQSSMLNSLITATLWLTGVIVSLSVGFAMANETLSLPLWLGGPVVAQIAGWIVVILTLLSVLLEIIEKLR